MLPLIGGVVAGLALGAAIGLTVLGPRLSASPAPASASKDAPAADSKDGEVKKDAAPPPMYQMDNLVLNPAGSGGAHFLLMSVALELKDAATLETLKVRDAELRDGILRLCSAKTAEQVSEPAARDQLRSELMPMLAKMFGEGAVKKVYFPQFVIQ